MSNPQLSYLLYYDLIELINKLKPAFMLNDYSLKDPDKIIPPNT